MKIETTTTVTNTVELLGDGYELFEDGYDFSAEECGKGLVDGLGAVRGEIEFDEKSFECVVYTKDGMRIEIVQDGEYNMYGGPYSPKFKNTYVNINEKNYTENFIHYMLTQNTAFYDNESEIDILQTIFLTSGIDKNLRDFIKDLGKVCKL